MPPDPATTAPPRNLLGHLLARWTWQMAWRDSRASRRRLLLFSSSIILGIAALVAIGSLGDNLNRAIEEQAKSLLGADLVLSSRDAFTPEAEALFRQIGGEQSREISLNTMVFFPRAGGTRLVQARALGGGFPYYGQFETQPASAAGGFRRSHAGALAEDTLLTQFDAQVGDELRLGKLTLPILGRLLKIPGETIALSAIAPRVYFSIDDLPATGLRRQGSLAEYRVYFKLPPQTDASKLVEELRPQLDKLHLGHDTVAERKRDLGRSMENLYHFLNLVVGFVALLLGAVGVASAIQLHIKQKLPAVAALRCLGASVSQTFAIYLAQAVALGVFGALVGAAIGVAIQTVLPRVFANFIPFTFQFHIAWLAAFRAMAIGFAICALFAIWPLLAVRLVSPLAAIRVSYEPRLTRRDPFRWALAAMLVVAIIAFALSQSRNWRVGLGFVAGLAVAFGVLAAMAKILIVATRRLTPAWLPFFARQGLANLHRPNNRTLLLLLSLGLGTFAMTALFLVQRNLLAQFISSSGKNQPNAVLFDIQPTQLSAVSNLLQSLRLPVLDHAPIVTMRLTEINGRSTDAIVAGMKDRDHRWAFRHEYRSSYIDHLRDGEKIVAGAFVPSVTNASGEAPISVSLEQGVAQELGVGLGAELTFDIQGVPVKTKVASIRTVEWRRIQPNFFVLFPVGAIEDAPAMHVLVTRVATSDASAQMQRAVVQAFPNVSIIDLTMALRAIDSIVSKISFVVRFMAMFTVLTGLVILISALVSGRYQRVQESILLRALGAPRAVVLRILAVEYLSLGTLAALTGIILSIAAAWALARFVFDMPFALAPLPLLGALLIVPGLTVSIGLIISRGILDEPPLAVLRSEAA